MDRTADVLIIGAGIVGTLIARELSKYELDIALIDSAVEVCTGASGANSATIHSGHSVTPGSLKGRLNLRGAMLWPALAKDLSIPFRRTGDFVVACGAADDEILRALEQQSRQNGVAVKLIGAAELKRMVPYVTPAATGALWCESTAVCDPCFATVAAAEFAVANGVHVYLGTAFEDFVWSGPEIVGVLTQRGGWRCRCVVNAAGVSAAHIMHRAGLNRDFAIRPRKGDYLLMQGSAREIQHQLAPVPSAITKGIAVKVTTDGDVLVGAQADDVTVEESSTITRAGLERVWAGARSLVPGLRACDAVACLTGVRASGCWRADRDSSGRSSDFIVGRDARQPRLINVAGVDSPGLTAAPALAEEVSRVLAASGVKLHPKERWNGLLSDAAKPAVWVRTQRLKTMRRQNVPAWFRTAAG